MNEVIIAGAGSGKTTYIVNKALGIKNAKVLITTFTEANEKEIISKFFEVNGCVPQNIIVQTWFSFLLEHGVRPYQGMITNKKINGLLLVNTKSGFKCNFRGRPVYWGEKYIDEHYFSQEYNIYSDKLSKFVYKCNELSNNKVLERISLLYPHIFIDEVQDMAGYDLDIIKLLLSTNINVILVGDPRQTIYHTHNEAKYSKYLNGNIKDFILKECNKYECRIDDTSLVNCFRCNQNICDLANKIFPHFPALQSEQREKVEHSGVYLVKPKDVDYYLNKYSPIQLRDSAKIKVNNQYPVMTFGNSKGLTFCRTLIYPTKPIVAWLLNSNSELAPLSRSKLYVALTRAKYSIGIVYDYGNENIDGMEKYIP